MRMLNPDICSNAQEQMYSIICRSEIASARFHSLNFQNFLRVAILICARRAYAARIVINPSMTGLYQFKSGQTGDRNHP